MKDPVDRFVRAAALGNAYAFWSFSSRPCIVAADNLISVQAVRQKAKTGRVGLRAPEPEAGSVGRVAGAASVSE